MLTLQSTQQNGKKKSKRAEVAQSALDANACSSLDDQDILMRLKRIYRLSQRPPNPGFAYRHLEYIHALTVSIMDDLGASDMIEEATTLDTDRDALWALWKSARGGKSEDASTVPELEVIDGPMNSQ